MPIYKTGKKNNDGLQQYRVTYNYTDPSGRYRQKTRLVYGSVEARFAEAQLMAQTSKEPSDSLTIEKLYKNYVLRIII